jgi:hypothetical protein
MAKAFNAGFQRTAHLVSADVQRDDGGVVGGEDAVEWARQAQRIDRSQ